MGIDALVGALKAHLETRGLDGSALDQVTDFTLGNPLPVVGAYVTTKGTGIGLHAAALQDANPNKPHFECPPLGTKGQTSCVQLVDAVVPKVKAALATDTVGALATPADRGRPGREERLAGVQGLRQGYLSNLALQIRTFGVDAAASRAEYTLRDAGVCDKALLDGEEIARLRGIEEGEAIIRRLVASERLVIAPQGGDCLRIGQLGPAEATLQAAVDEYIAKQSNAMCPNLSLVNGASQRIDALRREGIQRSIVAHTATIWVGMFRNGQNFGTAVGYVVAKIDGCEPKDQVIYTTSPLVVDLDGDGLEGSARGSSRWTSTATVGLPRAPSSSATAAPAARSDAQTVPLRWPCTTARPRAATATVGSTPATRPSPG
ncbi:MAG: hypothetical protein IPG96_06935 [Proteobacteria bacterium]|nr:hypothetical protein [Pseudomonadota bacterium]